MPPCRADARGRLLCAPTIAFQSGSLCAAHGGCVFLFRGWEDLASITIRLPKAISQGHLLCNNHRGWITAIEVAWVKALKRPVCTENVRSCCRLEVRAQERDCRPFSSVMGLTHVSGAGSSLACSRWYLLACFDHGKFLETVVVSAEENLVEESNLPVHLLAGRMALELG